MMNSPLFKSLGLASGMGGDPIVDRLDLRDALANLIGFGPTTMDAEARNNFQYLISKLGRDKAQRLMDHVFTFNNRADLKRASPQERLSAFYTIGSRDKELQDLIMSAKNLGKGPMAGLNESVNEGSMQLSGRIKPTKYVPGAANAVLNRINNLPL